MKNCNSEYCMKKVNEKRSRRKCYYTLSITLSAVVVFCTVYALILPAITMEKQQKTLDCPLDIHQHTDKCYDAEKKLVCGEADFVIHTHDENCYDEQGKLVCKLPEIMEHQHQDSCYKEGVLVCKLQEAEVHHHSDTCRDKNGTLTCGKLQTIEHVHGDACFQIEETTESSESRSEETETGTENNQFNTNENRKSDNSDLKDEDPASDENTQNDIMAYSETADGTGTDDSWGYNEDGSIYWTDIDIEQITVNTIQEDTPYVITGFYDNNLLTDEIYTKESASYLKAVSKNKMTDYEQYQRWCFEKIGEDGKYYIYYLKKNSDGTDIRRYLQFAGYGVTEWDKQTQQTILTGDKTQATIFDVSAKSKYPNYIMLSTEIDGTTFYLNSYYGDKPASSGNTTHWLGYPEDSEGSCLKVCQYNQMKVKTAKRVKTNYSTNSVINLFDYWIAPNREDPDNVDTQAANQLNSGINKDHDMKFARGDVEGSINLNLWTGQGALPRSGIVKNVLDDSGYPALSGDESITGTDSQESLGYLFDPAKKHEGKIAYKNVGGLLTQDKEDYYSFSGNKNMAEFNEKSNSIYVYDKPGAENGFFPFNCAPEIMTATKSDGVLNHYFGMTITTRFIQRHDGYTNEKKNTKTTFHFSGDDDVWIFIDGVLVGDVGGIHDACSVDIDFATGDVQVSVANGVKAPKTSLKECYQKAGKEEDVLWDETGKIFANSTMHTLKFFYLERGNYSSNLELKYNLTEIPKTAIEKVDEYGVAVPKATFAVYAADSSYQMRKEKDGALVQNLPDEYAYDEKGNIVDGAGKILVNALYTGITDENGELLFDDQDGMPYTIDELHDMFGDNFILREIKVPDGYRNVAGDIQLQIWKGDNKKILKCDNTSQSGARASTNLLVTATDTIHLRKKYEGSGEFHGKTEIQYCDPDTGETKGTLFAVVMKYTGKIDENGDIASSMNDTKAWTPVYGSDTKGYFLVDMSGEKDILTASIEAAKEAQNYGDVVFTQSSANSAMRLMIDNLPGHITGYYWMLSASQKKKVRYTVAYYWTDQSDINEATPENTYGVSTDAMTLENGGVYRGFDREFGSEIQIPNLINDVYVQKVDEEKNLINGATFALYSVQQQSNGEMYYRVVKADGTTSYVPLPKGAKPDSETGKITVDNGTITPVQRDVTKNFEDGIHKGTVRFANLNDGEYIIKEIKAPPGYHLNTSDIMVLVTKEVIYANAGTEEDGIAVGRGPGYVVSTLRQFASEGQIDNTLSWIYAQMQISRESTRFDEVGDPDTIMGYLKENYSSKVGTEAEAGRTYLVYDAKKTGTPFNYVENKDRTLENGAQNPFGTRRLFTTVGWPYYEIHQDYDYGLEEVKKSGANYEDWRSYELTNLYSRSTYIRVTDTNDVTLKLKKVDGSSKDVTLSNAQFRLYRLNSEKKQEYYTKDSQGNVVWNGDAGAAMVVTTGEDGTSQDYFSGLKDGTFYLEEIKAPEGYSLPADPVELKIQLSKLTMKETEDVVVDEVLDESVNLYTYTLTVPNSGGFELPSTGGGGIRLYIIGGILLMIISLVYGCSRKCRGERRCE